MGPEDEAASSEGSMARAKAGADSGGERGGRQRADTEDCRAVDFTQSWEAFTGFLRTLLGGKKEPAGLVAVTRGHLLAPGDQCPRSSGESGPWEVRSLCGHLNHEAFWNCFSRRVFSKYLEG